MLLLSHLLTFLCLLDIFRCCEWFGDSVDTPVYPVGVCLVDYHDDQIDTFNGRSVYSWKHECNPLDPNELILKEFASLDCSGDATKITTHKKITNNTNPHQNFYFNCDNKGLCSYVKAKIYELQNKNETDENGNKICTINTAQWTELAVITQHCMNFTEDFGYNFSYYVDCTASSAIISAYSGSDNCDISKKKETIIAEGCDKNINTQFEEQFITIDLCTEPELTTTTTTTPITTITPMVTNKPHNGTVSTSSHIDDSSSNKNLKRIEEIIGVVIAMMFMLIVGIVGGMCWSKKHKQQKQLAMMMNDDDDINQTIPFESLDDKQ